jgi:UMP-CMP kinase
LWCIYQISGSPFFTLVLTHYFFFVVAHYSKGTQCQLLKERTGWAHLSAGDLLRAERKSGGPMADLINSKINAGQIVPAEITCGLLQKGMEAEFAAGGCTKFLVDGFPRSQGNVTAWESTMSHHIIEFVLNLECPEEVLVGRLLERGQTSGRKDDEIDVIRKRFQTFQKECKPIVDLYTKKNMVRTIQSDQSVEAVYEEVSALFQTL